jgi:hypothetical protein
MEISILCIKCPSYRNFRCSIHDKAIGPEDEMCEDGYELRLNKGIRLLSELYGEKEKYEGVVEQVYELQKIFANKFVPKEEREEYLRRLEEAKATYIDVNNKKIEEDKPKETIFKKVPDDDIPF